MVVGPLPRPAALLSTVRDLCRIFIFFVVHLIAHITEHVVARWGTRGRPSVHATMKLVACREIPGDVFGFPRAALLHKDPVRLLAFPHPVYSGHVGTILGSFRDAGRVCYRREVLHSHFDGCSIAADWAFPDDNKHLRSAGIDPFLYFIDQHILHRVGSPFGAFGVDPPPPGLACGGGMVVSIVPGLMSESDAPYIRSFVRTALAFGFVVVVVHSRGLGTPLTTRRMFHGGFTGDLRWWVYSQLSTESLQQRLKATSVAAAIVGFSLGANVLAMFLAEDGEAVMTRSAVAAAVSVSAPWRFHDAAAAMARPVADFLYSPGLSRGLRQYLHRNSHMLRSDDAGFDFEKAIGSRTVAEFDERVVAPHHGYRSREEYYTDASCFEQLHRVQVPLLCMATCDDPICGPPPDARTEWSTLCQGNPNIAYLELPTGGHLGGLGHFVDEALRRPSAVDEIVCRSLAYRFAALRSAQAP